MADTCSDTSLTPQYWTKSFASIVFIPGSAHEARLAAGEHMQSPLRVALLGLRRLQSGEIAQDFLLPAGREFLPAALRAPIARQSIAEPCRHRMRRAASVLVV